MMRSMVSMMLAPGWRRMTSSTERWPLVHAAARAFSTSSNTRATSDSRTMVPWSFLRMMVFQAAAPKSWSLAVTDEPCPVDSSEPLGWLAVDVDSVARTSSSDSPAPASATGSACTRTAGCCPPPTKTCPTPCTWAIFCASTVFAVSNSWGSGTVFDVIERMSTGASAGFTFR